MKMKRKNRGFTLIELLAVIALIGLLMLLIIPKVLNSYEVSRKKSFAIQVESIKKEAEKKYQADALHSKSSSLYCDESFGSLGCSKLDIHTTEFNYLVELDDTGHVKSLSLSNEKYCYSNEDMASLTTDISGDDIAKGTVDCSTGSCVCFSTNESAKVSVTVENGNVDNSTVIVAKGANALFTITPDETYSVEDATVTGGCTLEGNILTYHNAKGTNTCNVKLAKQKYTVTIACDTCSGSSTNQKIEIGASASFPIVPGEGYTLEGATVSGSGCSLVDGIVYIENVTAASVCEINLKKKVYSVGVTCNNCTSTPATQQVEHAEETSFTISPKTGYTLTGATVTGGCSLNASVLSISNVKENKSCIVTLPKQKFTVSVTCTNCSSNPTSKQVEYGSSGTFTISALANYTLTGATVSGTGCSLSGSTLTASNVTSARTCTIVAPQAWKCASGTLTLDSSLGSSSGGYVCVTNASSYASCKNGNIRCKYDAYTLWGCDANYNYHQYSKPALTNQSGVLISNLGNCPNGVWGCAQNVRTWKTSPGTKYSKITGTSEYETASQNVQYMSSSNGLVYYTVCSVNGGSCSQSTKTLSAFETYYNQMASNYNAYIGYIGYIYQGDYYTVAQSYSCTITYGASEAGACAPVYRTGTAYCPDGQETVYTCPSGWTKYNADGSKCYKLATR